MGATPVPRTARTWPGVARPRMAAEGYRFYAEEAVAFAKASVEAVSAAISQDDAMEEVWNNEREAG